MHFDTENLLDHLRRPEFHALRSALSSRIFPRHAYISQPENPENMIFILSRGRARVYLGFEDKEFNLAILAPGDIYATHTSAYVQAMEEVELLTIGITAFQQFMANDQAVGKAMIKVLGNMLKASFAIIDRLMFKDAPCRLLSLILMEAKRQQKSHGGEIVLALDLSVEQIARLVGASRQTVSTELNKLIRGGVVQRKSRRAFLVPDIDALERLYEGNNCM